MVWEENKAKLLAITTDNELIFDIRILIYVRKLMKY